jgi:hypothetical protein
VRILIAIVEWCGASRVEGLLSWLLDGCEKKCCSECSEYLHSQGGVCEESNALNKGTLEALAKGQWRIPVV